LNGSKPFNGHIPEEWFSWTLDSDSRITISDQGNCAISTLDIVDGERTDSSETFMEGHRFNGISVDRSVIGTPLLDLTQMRRRWSEHCLPVFLRSPVTCKAAPSDLMTYREPESTNTLTVVSGDSKCNITSPELPTTLK